VLAEEECDREQREVMGRRPTGSMAAPAPSRRKVSSAQDQTGVARLNRIWNEIKSGVAMISTGRLPWSRTMLSNQVDRVQASGRENEEKRVTTASAAGNSTKPHAPRPGNVHRHSRVHRWGGPRRTGAARERHCLARWRPRSKADTRSSSRGYPRGRRTCFIMVQGLGGGLHRGSQ